MTIPSPYNFVPLSEKVFLPDWADQVSTDVPFADGIRGTVELCIRAETPLYIRNGGRVRHGQECPDNQEYTDFFRLFPGGPYAIPGTSAKGMIRNVLEIISFGKIVGSLSAPRVDNHRYAVRDLKERFYTGCITRIERRERSSVFIPKVRAGWLEKDNAGNWFICPCSYSRVEQEELERIFRIGLGNRQSAEEKYTQFGNRSLTVRFDPDQENDHRHTRVTIRYSKARNIGNGRVEGTIVLTGQPSQRQRVGCTNRNGQRVSRGKHMEFIFHGSSGDRITVPENVRKDFIFAHSELGENRNPNREWAYWKQKFDAGAKIPVFYLKSENRLASFGLAMMYRLPYRYDIHETIRHTSADHFDSRPDLAELVFGRVDDRDALRGRVSFESFPADGNPCVMDTVRKILNGPKPTFYPNYLKQNNTQKHLTYMDETAEIRGWKRYITREQEDRDANINNANANVTTAFRPLPSGTLFRGTMHLHNLKPVELGAVVWAVTWGGDNALRHGLGMAKPFGFGSVTMEMRNPKLISCNPEQTSVPDLQKCMDDFVRLMNRQIPGWENSHVIRSLKAIANPGKEWPQQLRYPVLGDGGRNSQNEFVEAKRPDNKESLVSPL